ncbi:MAG: DUF6690 family protein [Pirellulales bacterium]
MRRVLSFLLVAIAVAGPYLWSHPDALPSLQRSASSWFSAPSSSSSNHFGTSFVSTSPLGDNELGLAGGLPLADDQSSLAGAPITDFGELLRFDVTPDWVTSRWARVTTVISEQGWQGLRVPVVTGTQVDDLAGSLTYYFDSLRRVQRITFKGATGDPQRLISWAVTVGGMKRESTLAAELYTRRWSGRATAVLALQRQGVMRSDSPRHRIEVLLEVCGPQNRAGVSGEVQEWLTLHRA